MFLKIGSAESSFANAGMGPGIDQIPDIYPEAANRDAGRNRYPYSRYPKPRMIGQKIREYDAQEVGRHAGYGRRDRFALSSENAGGDAFEASRDLNEGQKAHVLYAYLGNDGVVRDKKSYNYPASKI